MRKKFSNKLIVLIIILIISFFAIPISFSKYTTTLHQYLTLKVIKTPEYTIQFDLADDFKNATGTMEPQVFKYGKGEALKPNEFVLPGYNFLYWSTNSDGTGERIKDKWVLKTFTNVDGAVVTFYANFVKSTKKTTSVNVKKLETTPVIKSENDNTITGQKDENEDTTIDTLKGFISEDLEENKAANSEEDKNTSIVEEKTDEEETKQTDTNSQENIYENTQTVELIEKL